LYEKSQVFPRTFSKCWEKGARDGEAVDVNLKTMEKLWKGCDKTCLSLPAPGDAGTNGKRGEKETEREPEVM